MKTIIAEPKGMGDLVAARSRAVRDWLRWAPSAAVVWSLIHAALGIYWAVSGRGFPYTPENTTDGMGPLLGQLGPGAAWIVVMLAGFPAAALGVAMLRGMRSRALRPFLIAAGGLLSGTLLLLMTGLNLLIKVGYLPAVLLGGLSVEKSRAFLAAWTQWATIHQLLCLVGGFLWLAATLRYTRQSGNACLSCGRREGPEGWTRPEQAARWGHTAVTVAMAVPVFYALTRYLWALGIPLGLSQEQFLRGQESGMWVSGALFLGNFCLVGALLMLGLVQRWGEVFPRWMIGLAGRRVPIALAVIPASLAAVLLVVGGIGIWINLPQMVANAAAAGVEGTELSGEIIFQLGPTLLFPVWGAALAVAALGYYYRRRGICRACGRGTSGEASVPSPAEPRK